MEFRRRAVVAFVLPTVGLVGGLTACGVLPHAEPTASRVPADFEVSEYGVRVSVRVEFPENRTIERAELRAEGGRQDVSPWPIGWEQDRPPETVELEAGDEVILEGWIVAACPGAGRLPRFEVVSTVDGEEVVDHIAPARAADYRRAHAEWCDRPVTLSVAGSRIGPRGRIQMYLEISNPGPDSVEVRVGALTSDTTTWEAQSAVVPPGTRHPLTVRGRARQGCGATPPWTSGNFRVDGKALTPQWHDGWC
jgi:hypothetical protein